jgi:hypothetical protein
MEKEELEEIRATIANEPEDSPARRLLAEMDRQAAEAKVREKARSLASLRGQPWWLSENEAAALFAHIEAGGKFEEEHGLCRCCDGDRSVVVGSGCFGAKTDTCPRCDGSGLDRHRVRVPGIDYTCKCDPVWWEAWQGRNKGDPRSHEHNCPRHRGTYEASKPEAESEL